MHIVEIITKKRDGEILSNEEIKFVIENYTKGSIPDYQISALLMAIFFNGMNDEESTNLALAMRDSGDIFDLSDIEGIKVDKHSTGGVGDKVTLILGPLLAYHGAKFAKMSGRGLGHTGGTIDKLESIPGYKVELSMDEFKNQVKKIGIAIVGQSGDIAPADKKLYALRDVTGTVDSIPLIAASIMSKKLASGSDAIVLDVKVGNGAFMKNMDDARRLAKLMVQIGKLANKDITAILTNMDEPLGHKIGNSLEVYESVMTLLGKGPKDLVEVIVEIGSHLLVSAKLANNVVDAKKALLNTLNSGKAIEKLKEVVIAQGGDVSYINNPEKLLSAPKKVEILASTAGFVESINALDIGKAGMWLGAGRETKDDAILLDVGIDLHKKIGDVVAVNDVIATLYVRDKGIEEASKTIKNAIRIGKNKNKVTLIEDIIK